MGTDIGIDMDVEWPLDWITVESSSSESRSERRRIALVGAI